MSAPDVPSPGIPAPPRPDDPTRGPAPPARAFPPAAAPTYAAPTSYGPAPGEAVGPSLLGPAGLHIPGASTLYTLLGLLLLAAGLLCLVMPYKLSDIFFTGDLGKHPDVLYEELWRILAACLLTAAITCYALKIGADRAQMNDFAVQRLQHGLFWFALLTILLHLVHLLFVKSLTFWGLLIGGVVMGLTLLIPGIHLGTSGGFSLAPMWEGYVVCMSNLFAPRRLSLTVFLYALLTVLFTLAGLAYLIIPKPTLKWTFGYTETKRTVFLWQTIGAALFTFFPAITYTCQAAAAAAEEEAHPDYPANNLIISDYPANNLTDDEERALLGRLHLTLPKALNVGLLVAALFHILEFGSLLVDGGIMRRYLLVILCVHWVLVLLTSIIGLSASPPAVVPPYEYEPLAGESA